MEDPEYHTFVEVINEPTRTKFIQTILKNHIIDFKTLYSEKLQISETNARHHLKILLEHGIVKKEKQKGTKAIYLRITPKFLERARKYFAVDTEYLYTGMTGIDNPGMQVVSAIERLTSENWPIQSIYIFTTQEAINKLEKDESWHSLKDKYTECISILVPAFAFNETYQSIKRVVETKIHQYSIVADVTGSTKIHTLALYSLAKEYGIKRVYLPREGTNNIITLP